MQRYLHAWLKPFNARDDVIIMTLRMKMGGAFGTLVLLLVITSAVSLFFMRIMQAQTTFFTNIATPSVVAAKQVERGLYQHYVALLEAIQKQGQSSALAEVQNYEQSVDVAHGKLEQLLTSDVYRQGLIASQKQVEAYMAQADRALALLSEGDAAGARTLLETEVLAKLKVFGARTVEADRMAADATAIGVAEVAASQRNSVLATIILVVVAVIIGLILSTLVYRSIAHRLEKLRAAFGEISGGNLVQTLPIEGNDEITSLARDFNGVTAGLRSAFTEISQSMEQLRSMAGELETGFERTTERSRHQQHELDAVATAMNEMASTTGEVAASAESAASSAHQADEQAHNSRDLVASTTSAIHHLSRRITDVAEQIRGVRDSSAQIESVLDVIQAIAEQTNLLALNAAIEAARAGEQGRGFAVVADEVRSLANRTQESARQVVSVIDTLRQNADIAVTEAAGAVQDVELVVERSQSTSESLNVIVAAVAQISEQNTAIATSAEEQSQVAQEMDRNIVRIHDASKETLSETEHAHATSGELTGLANRVAGSISRYRVV